MKISKWLNNTYHLLIAWSQCSQIPPLSSQVGNGGGEFPAWLTPEIPDYPPPWVSQNSAKSPKIPYLTHPLTENTAWSVCRSYIIIVMPESARRLQTYYLVEIVMK